MGEIIIETNTYLKLGSNFKVKVREITTNGVEVVGTNGCILVEGLSLPPIHKSDAELLIKFLAKYPTAEGILLVCGSESVFIEPDDTCEDVIEKHNIEHSIIEAAEDEIHDKIQEYYNNKNTNLV